MEPNKYVNKPVMFDRRKPEDAELYEWLARHLKQGEFTQQTKAYWTDRMREAKEERS